MIGRLRIRIVGEGRAGGAFARVFSQLGFDVLDPIGRGEDPTDASDGVDLVVIATPDTAIGEVAAMIHPTPDTLVTHLSGALGPDALGSHPRRGTLHPLVSIPDPVTGAARLTDGAWFAITADQPGDRDLLASIVTRMGGHPVHVDDVDRVAYHTAAVVASNHLVALFGQVERIAAGTGVPREAFVHLASQTLQGMQTRAPAEALTGPVRRGDWGTVAAHLEALDADERPAYAVLAEAAARLVDAASIPEWLGAVARGDLDAPGEAVGDDG